MMSARGTLNRLSDPSWSEGARPFCNGLIEHQAFGGDGLVDGQGGGGEYRLSLDATFGSRLADLSVAQPIAERDSRPQARRLQPRFLAMIRGFVGRA